MPFFDPAASLRMWATEVTIGGRVVRVPPLPAADWLPVVMSGDAQRALELADGDFRLAEVLLSGAATVDEVADQLLILVESACGRSWVTAVSTAAFARDRWDVVGADLIRIGIDLEHVPIARALDAIWSTILRSLPEKELKEFVAALDRAELGEELVEPPKIRPPRGAKPLPATAEQYVRVRPKTVLRRPQAPQGDPSVSPTPTPPARRGSGQAAAGGQMLPDVGVWSRQEV